tara:strand:+ start:176 stop:544 length:369 start_codon:yes stop_codon:yes gene_type:complete
MQLEYALVTSTSLPTEVKQSENFVSLDKKQWLDMVDYGERLVSEDPDQKLLFLICARGTSEQREADRLSKEDFARRQKLAETDLEEVERLAKEAAAREESLEKNRLSLRQKSKTIFNSLYGK